MKISIIMSVYNAEDYVEDAVESILQQSLGNFEFIIVNDGSDDGTSGILERFKSRDERIKVINQDRNLGLTASLNRALGEAKGEFIARQDADDISKPDRLQAQYDYMRANSGIDICSTYAWVMGDDGVSIYSFMYPTGDEEIKKFLNMGLNPIIHGSVMFRRNLISSIGDPFYRFRFGQDFDLWLRSSQFAKFAIIPQQLYRYRRGEGSVSRCNAEIKRELKAEIIKQHKKGNSEEWKEVEGKIFAKFANTTQRDLKSYSSAWLILLRGEQWKAFVIFLRNPQIRSIPLIIICLIPFIGWRLARKLHLKMSPYKRIIWA
jgi:glycosyltransferase involved in cell wall biosynthesis